MVVTLYRALKADGSRALQEHLVNMASSAHASRVEGSMCVLVKDCNVRSTKAGDLVVVIEHVRPVDDVVDDNDAVGV